MRLGSFEGGRSAVIVGVLEPSVPYPVETELIANVVTSPHHLSATMVTGREHRMTEVFARLAPGASLDAARGELRTTYAAMLSAHPEVYKPEDHFRIDVTRMHDQLNSRANTILWVLFAASALLFVIACSNVANLVLARTARRESELAVRSASGRNHRGASPFAVGGKHCVVWKRSVGRAHHRCPDGRRAGPLCVALLRARRRPDARFQPGVDWHCAGVDRRRVPGVCSPPALCGCVARLRAHHQRSARHRRR